MSDLLIRDREMPKGCLSSRKGVDGCSYKNVCEVYQKAYAEESYTKFVDNCMDRRHPDCRLEEVKDA